MSNKVKTLEEDTLCTYCGTYLAQGEEVLTDDTEFTFCSTQCLKDMCIDCGYYEGIQ